jgi:phosphatidylinositol alpha-1,6-mannosyltransferase
VPGARRLLRRIGDGCDHLTAVSRFTQDRIAVALSPAARDRLLRLPPPVDLERFRPGPARNDHDRPRAVAVGRFVPQKGFAILLRAWSTLLDRWPRESPRPELVLVGDGRERHRLLSMISKGGLTGTVWLTGAAPRADVIAELQRADVFALPMRTRLVGLNPEGLGLAALEAAACGLPVIVGGSGGAPESLLPGESGFVVPPDDHLALAGRLALLLTDRALARRMGALGRELVRARFAAENVQRTLRDALG